MQTTQESPSSSSAPPGTAPAGRAEADAEKGWGWMKPPLGLVSLPSVAEGGGPDASWPDPQELGRGGADTACEPLAGAKGLPAALQTVVLLTTAADHHTGNNTASGKDC